MARRSKGATAAPPATNTPKKHSEKGTPKSSKRKRGIDWSTVDEKSPFEGFDLKPLAASKKRKIGSPKGETKDYQTAPKDAEIVQRNPFEDVKLSDTYFEVVPSLHWESTGRYKKFTIDQAEFEVGDTVYIRADESQVGSKDAPVQGWVAKVLEVRAGDPNHVYLRIYWMYRPEDLPQGRQPYHGRNELIASNDMAIIDAMTVDAHAGAIHWQEDTDKGEILSPTQLIWRQTWDVNKNRLSELKKHCIDAAPCNPDQVLIQCDSCLEWLHSSCLETDALRKAYESHDLAYPGDDGLQAKGKKKRKSKALTSFRARISATEAGKTRLTITDKRVGRDQKSWDVPIECLLCKATIDHVGTEVQTNGDTTAGASNDGIVVGGTPHHPVNGATDEDDEQPDSAIGNVMSSPATVKDAPTRADDLPTPTTKSAAATHLPVSPASSSVSA